MTYAQGIVLGVVQGVSEFLPISSSGHLVLVPRAFGWPDQGLAFDAVTHLGTLAALLAYFRRELTAVATGALSRTLGLLLLAATVPGGLAGLLFSRWIEANLRSVLVIAASTAGWAVVMWLADRRAAAPPGGAGDALERVSWTQGLAVGAAQAIALVPGTSRSGITITTGLLAGLDRATAARYSFLLGVPITAAAGLFKALQLVREGLPPGDAGPLLAAVVAAFASGWLAVWFLVGYLRRRSLAPFVLYRLGLAAVLVAAEVLA